MLAHEPLSTFAAAGWRLESLALDRPGLRRAVVASGGRELVGYEYGSGDRAVFIKPDAILARLIGVGGQTIVLPARSLHHIERAHFHPGCVNRFADYVSVGSLLRDIARRLPAQLDPAEGQSRLQFEWAHEIGSDGLATRAELVSMGSLSAAGAGATSAYRHAVVQLNLFGDRRDKRAFVAEANRRLEGTGASFVVRGDSILVRHACPSPPTSSFSLVVDWSFDRRARVGAIRTIHPGRIRESLPAGRRFFSHYGLNRSVRGVAILDRLAVGLAIEDSFERAAVEAQRRAQDFWWQNVLLEPARKPAGTAEEDRDPAVAVPARGPSGAR